MADERLPRPFLLLPHVPGLLGSLIRSPHRRGRVARALAARTQHVGFIRRGNDRQLRRSEFPSGNHCGVGGITPPLGGFTRMANATGADWGTMRNPAVIAALLLTLVPVAATAETQEEQQACMNDAFNVCGDAIPDRDRVAVCLT